MLPVINENLKQLFALALEQIASKNQKDTSQLRMVKFDRPKSIEHGDLATNICMKIAKPWGMNPKDLAQSLIEEISLVSQDSQLIKKIEIAGPGFINIYLSQSAKQSVVPIVLEEKYTFGIKPSHKNDKVLLEFVSANPTGPLHVGHGRQAALGDCLSNLLMSQGKEVHREFYYNDAGVQINNLAISVQARIRGLEPKGPGWPEQAYNGTYILDIANAYMAKSSVKAADTQTVEASGDSENLKNIQQFAVAYLRNEQDIDLKIFGIHFDEYYLESSLYATGKVTHIVNDLTEIGKTYSLDSALWLKTTDDGDDKDRVMQKTDGTFTYFVPDIAYHISKWERGYHRVINIQGSDHHGTIARVRSGIQGVSQKRGLDIPKNYPDYVLHKMVTVMMNGVEVKISKRAGSYVTLRDLVDWSGGILETMSQQEKEIALKKGRDAVRFFLISRKADTEFVFDVDLALKENDENPVFYVQYAHARICSIIRQWGGLSSALINAPIELLEGRAADDLMRRLAEYPNLLQDAANDLAPHAVAFYLRDLAADFHSFYNSDRVLVDNESLKLARLALLEATRQVLRNGLKILGVSSPEKM